MNLFQNPRVFLHPKSEPKIRNSSLHSGASSGTLQFEPWRTTQSKGLPFSVSMWTLAPNQIFKKSGEGYGRNAQKCRHIDFESLPKWNPNWHPKNLSGDMSGNLGVPKVSGGECCSQKHTCENHVWEAKEPGMMGGVWVNHG